MKVHKAFAPTKNENYGGYPVTHCWLRHLTVVVMVRLPMPRCSRVADGMAVM